MRDRRRLAELDVGEVALDDVGRDLVGRGVDDDRGAGRGVEAGPDVDLGHDAGDRGGERRRLRSGCWIVGRRLRRLGRPGSGRCTARAWPGGSASVSSASSASSRSSSAICEVDAGGAEVGGRRGRARARGRRVSAVASASPSATVSPTFAVTSVTGHVPSRRRGRIVVADEVRVGAEERGRTTPPRRALPVAATSSVTSPTVAGAVRYSGLVGGVRAHPAERARPAPRRRRPRARPARRA